jgi:hypothetical protein
MGIVALAAVLTFALGADSGAGQQLSAAGADSGELSVAQVASCTSQNLLTNGDAEAGPINTTGSAKEPPSGWETTGQMRALAYGTATWPSADDPGPPNRGEALFIGGPSDPISTITQRIDLASRAATIDAGLLTYALCGWLGGFGSQGDVATLSVTFEGQSGLELEVDSIGPVEREDREDTTALLERSTEGSVPAGTRTAVILLLADRLTGASNDGYADNLVFTVAGELPSLPPGGPTRAIPLLSGFALLSWSGPDTPVTQAIASIADSVEGIWTWDIPTRSFRFYSPTAPSFLNSLETLRFLDAFWILLDRSLTWEMPTQ